MTYGMKNKNGDKVCWCPCGCSITDDYGPILDNGLCACCAAGVSHEVAPMSCRPSLKQLIRQHQSIIDYLTYLDNTCDICDDDGFVYTDLAEGKRAVCPDCNGAATWPFKNKDGLTINDLAKIRAKETNDKYGGNCD